METNDASAADETAESTSCSMEDRGVVEVQPIKDNSEDLSDIEQSRNSSDVQHESYTIVADFPTVFAEATEETMETPTKKFKSGDFLDNYASFLTGKPRLRKICDDQEIYEIEGVNVDLETLQSVKIEHHSANETSEISVEPTIKFAQDYENECSAAAANLAMQMQEDDPDDDSTQSDFLAPIQFGDYSRTASEISLLKSVAQKLRETQDVIVPSPGSSCGTLSPEQDTISPQFPSFLPKIKNNLDFPWTPLFEGKEGTSSPVSISNSSSKGSVSKVKFVDAKKDSKFVIPAAPGHTPFHHIQDTSAKKSPYRVTPHPGTGRTVIPAALKMGNKENTQLKSKSIGQSPTLKGDNLTTDANSSSPKQGMRTFSVTPSSSGSSNMVLNSSGSEEERSPTEVILPRTPFNTPVEGIQGNTTILSAKQLEELWKDSGDKFEDEGSAANRFQHNQKERVRRQRIKMSCDRLRTLIPGMTEKTDKATVFEFAAHYIAYLRSLLDHEYTPAYDKDFLKKATRLIAEEPLQ